MVFVHFLIILGHVGQPFYEMPDTFLFSPDVSHSFSYCLKEYNIYFLTNLIFLPRPGRKNQ